MRSRVHSVIVGVLLFCAIVVIGHSATITLLTITTAVLISLRRALAHANDGHTSTFAVSGTITRQAANFQFKNLTISWPGADQLSIMATSHCLGSEFPDQACLKAD